MGRTYTANFPNKVFLLVTSAATGTASGKFEFRVEFIDKIGEALSQDIIDSLKNISINDNKT